MTNARARQSTVILPPGRSRQKQETRRAGLASIRDGLASIDVFHAAWYLALALADIIRYRTGGNRRKFDRVLSNPETQWAFGNGEGDERYQHTAALLNAVRGKSRFASALEIGCGGGAFTEFLADQCERVVALDVSPVALVHARSRVKLKQGVTFMQLDLETDPLPGRFELIVAMDVLYYISRPWVMRLCAIKLIAALNPGGYLLLSQTKHISTVEHGHLTARFLRGASQIHELFSSNSELTTCSSLEPDGRLVSLFQKRPSAAAVLTR